MPTARFRTGATASARRVCIHVDFSGNVEQTAALALHALTNTESKLHTPGSAVLGQDQYPWFSWAYRAP